MNFSHFFRSTKYIQIHEELWCVNYVIYIKRIPVCHFCIWWLLNFLALLPFYKQIVDDNEYKLTLWHIDSWDFISCWALEMFQPEEQRRERLRLREDISNQWKSNRLFFVGIYTIPCQSTGQSASRAHACFVVHSDHVWEGGGRVQVHYLVVKCHNLRWQS